MGSVKFIRLDFSGHLDQASSLVGGFTTLPRLLVLSTATDYLAPYGHRLSNFF